METAKKRRVIDILPEINLDTIAPPYPNYHYFQDSAMQPFHHAAKGFDVVNAWWLIEASILAYSGEELAREKLAFAGLPEMKFFSGRSTQCFVATNDDFLLVAFRGTEIRQKEGTSGFENIWADLKTDFDIMLVDSEKGGHVHRGFKEAIDEVWLTGGLLNYIQAKDDGHRSVWFTGHSLGAALATLAADRYDKVRGLYTFGSPRIGDEAFKKKFSVNGYRIVNHHDLVTKVPPRGLYHHVGELEYIDDQGLLHENQEDQEDFTNDSPKDSPDLDNSFNRLRPGLAALIPDSIIDHVPLIYSIHLWNNIV